MTSKVYYADARVRKWDYKFSLPGKLDALLYEYDLSRLMEKGEWVAVKLHYGSDGAFRTIRPIFIRKVIDEIKRLGGKPFLTDTVRIKGLEYLAVATENGINQLSCGAPLVLADGLYGMDQVMVPVPGGVEMLEASVARAVAETPCMIVLSHFKGHIQSGFGGAIKNIAMGCISGRCAKGKQHRSDRGAMHQLHDVHLTWNQDLCDFCEQCINVCPLECIRFEYDKLIIDDDDCWACGRCMRACPTQALTAPFSYEKFQRSMAEGAAAVLSTFKPGKVGYLNFIIEVQPECDCMPGADTPVVQDQGILVSDDPVAIDQASCDLVNKAPPLPQSLAEDLGVKPGDKILEEINKPVGELQLIESEKLGLGTRSYELTRIG